MKGKVFFNAGIFADTYQFFVDIRVGLDGKEFLQTSFVLAQQFPRFPLEQKGQGELYFNARLNCIEYQSRFPVYYGDVFLGQVHEVGISQASVTAEKECIQSMCPGNMAFRKHQLFQLLQLFGN